MRQCPSCQTSMNIASLGGHAVDCCPRCAGVFLDAHEGSTLGVDFAVLFGFGARPLGASSRPCPDHQQPMTRFSIASGGGSVEIDRAACCGGVFLDAGEAQEIGQPVTHGEAPATAAATGSAKNMVCPACQGRLAASAKHGFSIEQCVSCEAIFYDGGEPEKAGIETSALFADDPWSATLMGESKMACPTCHSAMTTYYFEHLGQERSVEFAPCCGGVFVMAAVEPFLRFAARVALYARADAEYASGQQVTPQKSSSTPAESEGVKQQNAAAEAARFKQIDAQVKTLQQKVRRNRRRQGH